MGSWPVVNLWSGSGGLRLHRLFEAWWVVGLLGIYGPKKRLVDFDLWIYTYRNLIFGSVVYTYRNPILLPRSCSGLLNFMPDPPCSQPEKSADPLVGGVACVGNGLFRFCPG